jgi:hypothetical protein
MQDFAAECAGITAMSSRRKWESQKRIVLSNRLLEKADELLRATKERLARRRQKRVSIAVSDGLDACSILGELDLDELPLVKTIPDEFKAKSEGSLCPECRGTGKYVGLLIEEACSTCGGMGRVTSINDGHHSSSPRKQPSLVRRARRDWFCQQGLASPEGGESCTA